jgi:hypothetical protein
MRLVVVGMPELEMRRALQIQELVVVAKILLALVTALLAVLALSLFATPAQFNTSLVAQ